MPGLLELEADNASDGQGAAGTLACWLKGQALCWDSGSGEIAIEPIVAICCYMFMPDTIYELLLRCELLLAPPPA